jgi:hypothetical protein
MTWLQEMATLLLCEPSLPVTFDLITGKGEPIALLSKLSTAKELEQCTRLDEHHSQVMASFSGIESIQSKPFDRFLNCLSG